MRKFIDILVIAGYLVFGSLFMHTLLMNLTLRGIQVLPVHTLKVKEYAITSVNDQAIKIAYQYDVNDELFKNEFVVKKSKVEKKHLDGSQPLNINISKFFPSISYIESLELAELGFYNFLLILLGVPMIILLIYSFSGYKDFIFKKYAEYFKRI